MGSKNYYIANARCVVAGNVYDQHVYYQDPNDRLNAVFALVPTANGFLIRDLKHGKCLVAGNVYDGHVYHQDPEGRPNAVWNKVVKSVDANGVETVYLIDRKHGKALVSNGVADNNLYHQDPAGNPNALWTLRSLESKVCLRSYGGQYVQVDPADGKTICTKHVAVGGWEPFDLINLGGGKVALRASNGNYVSALNGGGAGIVATQSDVIGLWETFNLIDRGTGSIALQAANGQYFSSDHSVGGVPMVAKPDWMREWETFGIVRQPTAFSFETIRGGLNQVSVASDGTVWGVDQAANVYRWNGGWEQHRDIALTQIAVGSKDLVWGLNANGNPFKFNGSSWDQMPGQLSSLSVAADGTVCGVNNGVIYRWNGTPWWDVIPGTLARIFAGSANQMFGLDSSGNVQKWNASSSSWQQIPGNMKSLAIAADGTVMGVTSTNGVCLLRGDGTWEHLPVNLSQVSLSGSGLFWGVDVNREIVRGVAVQRPAVDPNTLVAVNEEVPSTNIAFPLYRYSTESKDAATAAGWNQLGVAFVAHSQPQPGTVPIYKETQTEHFNLNFHFWHRTDTEARSFGWEHVEVAFHAFVWPAPGTIPVFRETAQNTAQYHFSANSAPVSAEKGFLQSDVAFYAYPPDILKPRYVQISSRLSFWRGQEFQMVGRGSQFYTWMLNNVPPDQKNIESELAPRNFEILPDPSGGIRLRNGAGAVLGFDSNGISQSFASQDQSSNTLFKLEQLGNGTFRLRSASGKYVTGVCDVNQDFRGITLQAEILPAPPAVPGYPPPESWQQFTWLPYTCPVAPTRLPPANIPQESARPIEDIQSDVEHGKHDAAGNQGLLDKYIWADQYLSAMRHCQEEYRVTVNPELPAGLVINFNKEAVELIAGNIGINWRDFTDFSMATDIGACHAAETAHAVHDVVELVGLMQKSGEAAAKAKSFIMGPLMLYLTAEATAMIEISAAAVEGGCQLLMPWVTPGIFIPLPPGTISDSDQRTWNDLVKDTSRYMTLFVAGSNQIMQRAVAGTAAGFNWVKSSFTKDTAQVAAMFEGIRKKMATDAAADAKAIANVHAQILKSAGYAAVETANAIKTQLAADAAVCTSALRFVGYADEQIALGLKNVYNLTQEQVKSTLTGFGANLQSFVTTAISGLTTGLSTIGDAIKHFFGG